MVHEKSLRKHNIPAVARSRTIKLSLETVFSARASLYFGASLVRCQKIHEAERTSVNVSALVVFVCVVGWYFFARAY